MSEIPASHITDAQQTQGDAEVQLFQIDLYGGGTVYLTADQDQLWNGNQWEAAGIRLTGEGSYGDEQVSRPRLVIQNPDAIFSTFMGQLAFDMAIVTRYKVLLQDIYDEVPVYVSQVWQVGRVVEGNRITITLELRGMMDAPNFVIPSETFSPPKFPTVSF